MWSRYLSHALLFVCTFQLSVTQTVVTVDTCTRMDTAYTITGGSTTGQTYVETSSNSACVFGITDGTSDSFTVNFANCGVTYTEIDSGRIIEFVIVTQKMSAYNSATDLRFKVSCMFATGESTVMDIVVTSSNAPDGTPDKDIPVSVNPVPRMILYKQDNTTLQYSVVRKEVVTLGQQMMLMVDLDQNLPDYEILVKRCYVQAEMPTVVGSLDINDQDSHCALYPNIFNSFVYSYTPPNSYPYATAEFEAFMPAIPSVNLRTSNVTLRYLCRVEVCIRGTGCSHPSCSRRRRQVASFNPTNSTSGSKTYTLTSGHTILIGGSTPLTDPVPGNTINPTETGTNSICLNQTQFWVVLFSLFLLFLAACTGICCWFLAVRKGRRFRKKDYKYSVDDRCMVETITQTGESAKGQLHFLPRFVHISTPASN